MSVRDAGPQPLTSRCPATQSRHLGRGPCFVDKDEAGRIEIELAFEPRLAAAQDVRTVLLACMGGRFLNVRPARSRKFQIVPTEADTPASLKRRPASRQW